MTLRRQFYTNLAYIGAWRCLFISVGCEPNLSFDMLTCATHVNFSLFFPFHILDISAPKCKHSCPAHKKQPLDSSQFTLSSFRKGSLCEQPLFKFQTHLNQHFKLTCLSGATSGSLWPDWQSEEGIYSSRTYWKIHWRC